jgi:hypothetical protein
VHVVVAASDNPGGSGVAETRCVLDPGTPPANFDDIPTGCPYAQAGADVSTDGTQVLYAASKDAAGNNETPLSKSFKIDKTPPRLAPTVSPNPVSLNGTATVLPNASDPTPGSGLASASCDPVDTSSVGTKTGNCTATDNAGNRASASYSYVVGFAFAGFFSPVDNPPTLNAVKAGSGIPVKFSLAGNQGLSIFIAGSPSSQKITCDSSAPVEDVDQTVSAGSSSLSFDASSGQYIYVWKTDKAWAGSCRQLDLRLVDGSDHIAHFKFGR